MTFVVQAVDETFELPASIVVPARTTFQPRRGASGRRDGLGAGRFADARPIRGEIRHAAVSIAGKSVGRTVRARAGAVAEDERREDAEVVDRKLQRGFRTVRLT
jgi:hypothetical protein